MTNEQSISDLLKVHVVASVGVATPVAGSFLDGAVGWLNILLKLGQLAVVVATLLYTLAKWRKLRSKKKDE